MVSQNLGVTSRSDTGQTFDSRSLIYKFSFILFSNSVSSLPFFNFQAKKKTGIIEKAEETTFHYFKSINMNQPNKLEHRYMAVLKLAMIF